MDGFALAARLTPHRANARVESVVLRHSQETSVDLSVRRSRSGASRALLTPQQQSSLAERIRSREPSAEEELVRLFGDRVMFLVLARTRDREAARDVAQDVMLAVVRALRNGQLAGAGTTGGVRLRHRAQFDQQPSAHPQPPAERRSSRGALHLASTPEPVETSERIALVRRALGALDPTDRKILLLTLVEGLKPGEIAARLGLTSEVVRTRKSRALKKTIERVKKLSRR